MFFDMTDEERKNFKKNLNDEINYYEYKTLKGNLRSCVGGIVSVSVLMMISIILIVLFLRPFFTAVGGFQPIGLFNLVFVGLTFIFFVMMLKAFILGIKAIRSNLKALDDLIKKCSDNKLSYKQFKQIKKFL